jgi:RNA polymerase sigma-70 factor, ECF subfamily
MRAPDPETDGTGRAMSRADATACEQSRRRYFEAQVERLLDKFYGTALRLTRDPTEAEDLVAEALTRAWAGLAAIRDPQAFEKWVSRILVNCFVSERRRRQARPREETAEDAPAADGFSLFETAHQPFLLWWGNPEQQLLDKMLRQDIVRALEGLPDAYRVVVILVEVQGLSYAEAAEALEVPVGTIRSRLSRARSMLQRALARQARQLGIGCGPSGGGGR